MNHVQSVDISDIPPAGVQRFMGIYPSGLRPSQYIPINLGGMYYINHSEEVYMANILPEVEGSIVRHIRIHRLTMIHIIQVT